MSRIIIDFRPYADKLDERGVADVTMLLQSAFCDAHHNIRRAELHPGPFLTAIVGLRSSILEPFERFVDHDPIDYMPCDIPSLISGVALILTQVDEGLTGGAIIRANHTAVALMFEAPDLQHLADTVERVMVRWQEWTNTIMEALKQEPVNGDWNIEWNEFLAGESGFITMNWFKIMDRESRMTALRRVAEAAKMLLTSVLTRSQLGTPLVRDFVTWLDSLTPLPEIIGDGPPTQADREVRA